MAAEEILEELEELAASLYSEEAIVSRIRELDIKGVRRSETSCAIARLVHRELGVADERLVTIDCGTIYYCNHHVEFDDSCVLCTGIPLPAGACDFILKFDSGYYPEFVEEP